MRKIPLGANRSVIEPQPNRLSIMPGTHSGQPNQVTDLSASDASTGPVAGEQDSVPLRDRVLEYVVAVGFFLWLGSILLVYAATGGNWFLAIAYALVCGGVFGHFFGSINT
jgi:hypothetical protein